MHDSRRQSFIFSTSSDSERFKFLERDRTCMARIDQRQLDPVRFRARSVDVERRGDSSAGC
jgi:hypothetical protein